MENEDFISLISQRYDPKLLALTAEVDTLQKVKDTLEREIEDFKHEI
jgi:hypothetical protein